MTDDFVINLPDDEDAKPPLAFKRKKIGSAEALNPDYPVFSWNEATPVYDSLVTEKRLEKVRSVPLYSPSPQNKLEWVSHFTILSGHLGVGRILTWLRGSD